MSMRKDREITIIRENSSKSSGAARRLSVSLTEALLEDSTDPLLSLYEGTFLNEERVKIPGPDKKFVDQHPEVRELAKGVGQGKTSPVDIDIEGIPLKRIEITNNKNGIPRVYSDPSEAQKWRGDKRTTAGMQEPVIEITPAASGSDPGADDDADDLEQQVAAEREQSRVSPEGSEESEGELDGGDEPEGGGDGTEEPIEDLDSDSDTPIDGDNLPADAPTEGGPEEDSDSEAGGGESGVEGGAAGPTDSPPGGDVVMGGETEGEPEAGPDDDSAGPGDDTAPPPAPTGSAKDISDYIDKVARGEETVNLSEIRRPLHKRSLIELLYSS